MSNKIEITASIVLFNEDITILHKTVNSFLKISKNKKLFLIDNSPTDKLKKHFINLEIEYVFIGRNIGFGKAHNLILDRIKGVSKFHLILNPDVTFQPTVIDKLVNQLKLNSSVSMVSPKVLSPNGELQYTCHKSPTFFGLLYRKLGICKNKVHENEYRNQDLTKSFFPEFIFGSFMLFNTKDFLNSNGFDERYFLYMEDADICREQYKNGRKILYFPEVYIQHLHRRESSKNLRLFFIHLLSAIKYFKKWGF